MSDPKLNYLETAHRNIAWFKEQYEVDHLVMRPPFQRNPVWLEPQKSYLIDTILRGLPVPELYMQDVVKEDGSQSYVVVDGQQRIRACLEYLEGGFRLDDEESPEWGALAFDELSPDDKKRVFGYKFVIRTLPEMPEADLRDIFKRLNRNTVALNQQELRHATYWGPFIKTVEAEAEDNPFWSDCGLFTANDFRRMLDVEFIAELAVAILHGVQDKKTKLDHYFQLYETEFPDRERVKTAFRNVTGEVGAVFGSLKGTRWARKSDFYSLFLALEAAGTLPLASDARARARTAVLEFGEQVTEYLRLEREDDSDEQAAAPASEDDAGPAEDTPDFPSNVVRYGKAVGRAATDLAARRVRHNVLTALLGEAIQGSA